MIKYFTAYLKEKDFADCCPWLCAECRIRDGVKGIHLTVDKLGRPSGRAFIEMEHEADVGKALEKHRQYLGPRYVEGSSAYPSQLHSYSNDV